MDAEKGRRAAETETAELGCQVSRLHRQLEAERERVEDEKMREGLVEELRTQVEELDEHLERLQAEVSGSLLVPNSRGAPTCTC